MIALLVSLHSLGQSWQATHLTSVTYLPIVMENHNGTLYATVFNSVTATLNKLNADNASWTTISTGADITVPRFMKSAGSKMYMTTVNSGVYSMVYHTTDGSSFTLDTVGLPHSFGGVTLITRIQYYKGKVIVAMSGNGYYLKDTADAAWHSINCPTAFNAPSDPLTYFNDTLYAYDNSGADIFYVSGDWGMNWTARTTNLPTDYSCNLLVADEVTGRLYAAGAWSSAAMYGLKYSDDHGVTWTTSTAAAPFMSLNYMHSQQHITAIYAHDPTVYLALENNADNTAPDIIGSTSGLANLAYDTVGLPAAGGAANGFNFLMYQGKLALALNVIDVYLKGVPNYINEPMAQKNNFSLYPNPCTDRLIISSKNNATPSEIKILDCTGKVVRTLTGDTKQIDVTRLPAGTYLVTFVYDGKASEIQQFVKE